MSLAFQEFNPLDRLFLAIDGAWQRCGLPGVDIWIQLECRGRIDRPGFRRALAGLHRRYPATDGRLVAGTLFRRGGWELRKEQIEKCRWPQGVEVTAVKQREKFEELFNSRIDWSQHSPFAAHLFSSTDGNDVVLFRWPHFFADARGGVTLIEELARLYDEGVEPGVIESAGDERRHDAGSFDNVISNDAGRETTGPPTLARPVRKDAGPGKVVRVPLSRNNGRETMRLIVRRLDEGQTENVLATAMQVCGFARLADFVRACAIRTLHEEIGGMKLRAKACYSTMHLIEGRKRRDPGPVCHNLFAAVPVFVPTEIAADRRAIADWIQATALAASQAGRARHNWRSLGRLARVPTPLLATLLAANLRASGRWLPVGLTNAPSMPLGFMGPLSKPRPHFCGAELSNIFGVRPASYHAGFAINVNYAQGRMNIAASYFQPRISEAQIERMVDRFATLLQTPGDG